MKTDDISAGGQIDFQVQAFIGYYTMQESTPDPLFHRTHTIYTFHGESSDWGNTQTLTIPETSSLSTLIVMFAVFLGIIVTLLLLLFRRHRKTISQNKPNV